MSSFLKIKLFLAGPCHVKGFLCSPESPSRNSELPLRSSSCIRPIDPDLEATRQPGDRGKVSPDGIDIARLRFWLRSRIRATTTYERPLGRTCCMQPVNAFEVTKIHKHIGENTNI